VPIWTTPADIRAETERLWTRGFLLASVLQTSLKAASITLESGASIAHRPQIAFPYRLRLRGPRASELGSSFEAVRHWVQTLAAASRAETGAGFDINWEEVNTRELGRNRLPSELTLPSLEDALTLIGRSSEAALFAELATATVARLPELHKWIERKPLVLLEHRSDWLRTLDVVAWFAVHPRSGLYARQIDIAGVDTKFIESRKVLLGELLDVVLPADAIQHAAIGVNQFETRYGLAVKPLLVRFRVLDENLAIAGLTDLTVPVPEFAKLDNAASRVFIVENEVTALAFPALPDSLLIFGGGYGIDRLAPVQWLCAREVVYWGDIDTHGFAILDRLRALFPQAKSLLMDRETLLTYRAQWSFEAAPQTADLQCLNINERTLYDEIRFNRLGSGVRLEQERIPLTHLNTALGPCK